MSTAQQIVEFLGLQPLPEEGGHFRQTYLSEERISVGSMPSRYRSEKGLGSAIYYFLSNDADSFSALHRLATDEIYHFYLGDPVDMLLLQPDGSAREVTLGPRLLEGQHLQFVVPRGVWQGSRLRAGGQFALLGCTMAPAFTPDDFECGRRTELQAAYPEQAAKIQTLTR